MGTKRRPLGQIDFAPVEGAETIQQAIERRHRQWAVGCYGDYAFDTMLLGNKRLRAFHRIERFSYRDGEKPEIFLVVKDTQISRKML